MGPVPAGTVWVAEATSSRWSLRVDGESARRRPGFGWGSTFEVGEAGAGTLRYDTPPLHWVALAAQVALWAAVVVVLVLTRRRRGDS